MPFAPSLSHHSVITIFIGGIYKPFPGKWVVNMALFYQSTIVVMVPWWMSNRQDGWSGILLYTTAPSTWEEITFSWAWDVGGARNGEFLKWGYPNSWMVYSGKPPKKLMIWGTRGILGNHQMALKWHQFVLTFRQDPWQKRPDRKAEYVASNDQLTNLNPRNLKTEKRSPSPSLWCILSNIQHAVPSFIFASHSGPHDIDKMQVLVLFFSLILSSSRISYIPYKWWDLSK